MREGRRGYTIKFMPLMIGCLGGGIQVVLENMNKLFDKEEKWVHCVVMEMSKTVLFESESIVVTIGTCRALFELLFCCTFGRGGADVLRGGDMLT